MSNFTNLNEIFHIFSKTPVADGQTLASARNKSGHTVTVNDIWADDIPAFFSAPTETHITNIINSLFSLLPPGTSDALSRPWRTSAESCASGMTTQIHAAHRARPPPLPGVGLVSRVRNASANSWSAMGMCWRIGQPSAIPLGTSPSLPPSCDVPQPSVLSSPLASS